MKVRSTLRISALLISLLMFNNHSVFGRFGSHRSKKHEVHSEQNAVLIIGDYEGIDEKYVKNAVLLVTQELSKQGISVGDPVYDSRFAATVYRFVLRRLDEKILFRLSQEDFTGKVLITREIQLTDIKMIASMAPRLVYALVHRKSLISPSVSIDIGTLGTLIPVKKVNAYGAGFGLSADRLSYAVDLGGRFAVGWTDYIANTRHDFNFQSISIGGRYYFFSRKSVSPYIGGGFAAMFAEYQRTVRTPDTGFWAKLFSDGWDYKRYTEVGDGLGAYGVFGIELERFSRGRLKLELRIDRPFFHLPSQDVMPITMGIAGSYLF